MPRPLPQPVRQQIWDRCCLGQTPADIATALHLKPRTVQALVARFQQAQPLQLGSSYHSTHLPHPLHDEVLFFHQEHPTWGGPFLRIILQGLHPEQAIPSARTLQR